MKRFFVLFLAAILLIGCTAVDQDMDDALQLRQKLLSAEQCSFDAKITADYGDKLYTFQVSCIADSQGCVSFRVMEPETISGITGTLEENQGKLTFDGQALAFETLADGQVTPVSAPWILLHTLRSGYITGCSRERTGIYLVIDDSYADDALTLNIWLDEAELPRHCEISYRGRRIVSVAVSNFVIG